MSAPVADPLRDLQMMFQLVQAEQTRDNLRAAAIRHERRVARARAALSGAEGRAAIAQRARTEAHRAAGLAMLRAHDADRECARARLAVCEATAALREVEAEEVHLTDIPAA